MKCGYFQNGKKNSTREMSFFEEYARLGYKIKKEILTLYKNQVNREKKKPRQEKVI